MPKNQKLRKETTERVVKSITTTFLKWYERSASRKYSLALLVTIAGILGAFVLPIFFPWLQGTVVRIFIATCGVATAYITGNVAMDFINKKYSESTGKKDDVDMGDFEEGA